MKYPLICNKCSQSLYGLVKYCPYCGFASVLCPSSLTIKTQPDGAEVFLNDDRKGNSPLSINDLEKGKYNVRLESNGYQPTEKHVILGQENLTLDIKLEPESLAYRASLTIKTQPGGAAVFLNDDRKGNSPLSINDLEKGKYNVRLESNGYQPTEKHVILGQESLTLDIKLEPESPAYRASLTIKTQPGGAAVFLNGDRKGNSPLTINDLEKGKYNVRLESNGYQPTEKHVTLGQETQILDIVLAKEKPQPKYWIAAVSGILLIFACLFLYNTVNKPKNEQVTKVREQKEKKVREEAIKIDQGQLKTNSMLAKNEPPRNEANNLTSNNSSMKQDIAVFINTYLRDSSNENVDALLTHYNDKVNYYAKGSVEKKFISRDKEAYFKRWPNRTYKLASDIKISGASEDSSQIVQFDCEFHVWNDNRAIRGLAENILKLRFNNGMWHILDEKQRVLSRESS